MKYLLSFVALLFFTVALAAQTGPFAIGADIGWRQTDYRFSNNESSGLNVAVNFHVNFAERWWLETGVNHYAGRGDRPILEGQQLSISLRHQSISLPLRFGYEVLSGERIRLAAFGGVYAGYEGIKEIYYLDQVDFDASDAEFQNSFGYGANFGTRLSYQSGRFGYYLQPEYLYGWISSGDEHDSLDAIFFQRRQQSLGMKLGVLIGI